MQVRHHTKLLLSSSIWQINSIDWCDKGHVSFGTLKCTFELHLYRRYLNNKKSSNTLETFLHLWFRTCSLTFVANQLITSSSTRWSLCRPPSEDMVNGQSFMSQCLDHPTFAVACVSERKVPCTCVDLWHRRPGRRENDLATHHVRQGRSKPAFRVESVTDKRLSKLTSPVSVCLVSIF